MSIAAIVTRGYGSYSDASILPSRGYDYAAEEAEAEATVVTTTKKPDLRLDLTLTPIFVQRFFRR